jgi:hypothetical protein
MPTDETPLLGEVAYDTLTDLHADQDERVTGFYKSQSLRHLLRHLTIDDEAIIKLQGGRRVNETSHDIPFFGYSGIQSYLDPVEIRREIVELDFDKVTEGEFSSDGILGWLDEDENEEIYDLPIDRLVFRYEDDQLYEHLWEFIQETLDAYYGARLQDQGEFQQPFYVVMEANDPGHPRIRRMVEDFHPERYFLRGDNTDLDGNRGLGQQFRTMDLTAIWSHRAYTHSDNVIATETNEHGDQVEVTIRDIENRVVNHISQDTPEYGAINSRLLANHFRRAFHQGIDRKSFDWEEQEGWVQTG